MSMVRALSHRGMGDATYDALLATFEANAINPADFAQVRPGRPVPDPTKCLQIQCGAISQAEAGIDLLADCSFDGFAGVRTCSDPLCAPYCTQTANAVAVASQPLPVVPRVAATFSQAPPPQTTIRGRGCSPIYSGPRFGGPYGDASCGCEGADFINDHWLLALALLGAAGYGIWKMRKP